MELRSVPTGPPAEDTVSIGTDPATAGIASSGGAIGGAPHDAPAGVPTAATAGRLLNVASLAGGSVRGPADSPVGRVRRVLADPQSGQLAYVVIELVGVVEAMLRAVPWHAFVCDSSTAVLRLDRTADELRQAPPLEGGEVPADDPEWVDRVHVFFGCRPYWVP